MTPTTTPTKAIPTHYQDVIDKALEMDWDVEKSPQSVKVIPPKGSKIKPFSLPRTTTLAPPQLTVVLEKNGFTSTFENWLRSEGKAETKTGAKATAATKPEKEVRVCPECKADPNVKEPFSTTHPPALGVHRRSKHGILGGSSEAVRKRGVTAAKKAAGKKATAKKAPTSKTSAPAPAAAGVPAPRAAAPVANQEPLINVSTLPVPVAAPLGEMLTALQTELGKAAALQTEVQTLRDFRDLVEAEVNDGNKAPVQVVASILDLVKETKQK